MGNGLSPICFDIVMSHLQKECIKNLPFDHPFLERYVDDILTCVPDVNSVETILNKFNSFHRELKFTVEIEKDKKILFLVVIFIRTEENKIISNWYNKLSFSERFLNYWSEHTMKQKVNIFRQPIKYRALKLSNPIVHEKNMEKIKCLLQKNAYPKSLIK